jgi:hypothetical protein
MRTGGLGILPTGSVEIATAEALCAARAARPAPRVPMAILYRQHAGSTSGIPAVGDQATASARSVILKHVRSEQSILFKPK